MCSGIEAASVAWSPLGKKASLFAEIDKFPSEVLAHHYPEVLNIGDMTLIAELVRGGLLHPSEVLVGGTPCQSWSISGLRGGMDDPRGRLTLSWIGILDALDEVRGHGNEAVGLWENVCGVLSDKKNGFGEFLGKLAGEDSALIPTGERWPNAGCVFGPKRVVAWRVCDAKYFGVAQRRRRVFLVASARKGFSPCEVLFESEGVSGPTQPWIKEWATEFSENFEDRPFDMLGFGQYGNGVVASTCKARDYKDATDLVVTADGRVRRLTPTEYERLQGFPDGYTAMLSDTERYKALGNSMAVPCMAWIGKRLWAQLTTLSVAGSIGTSTTDN